MNSAQMCDCIFIVFGIEVKSEIFCGLLLFLLREEQVCVRSAREGKGEWERKRERER